MRKHLFFLLGLALGGCAWEPGQGFAVVEPTVRAAYEPLSDRVADNGYQRLSSDYQVRVESASLRLSGIELRSSSGEPSAAFDPAHPPPGYTVCHNGHCDREDGALIPYEQVAAEMGGGGGARTVVTLPVGEPFDLLHPETRAVGCEPECALPDTQVTQGRWGIQSLHFEGTVRDSRAAPRVPGERHFELDLAPAAAGDAPVAVLDGEMDLPSDRTHPPQAKLDLDLVLTAALFDAVDWSTLKQDPSGGVDFNDPANAEARKALLERLARFAPKAEVTRGNR